MPASHPFVCLLRGVNVGGNNLLKMDVLRSLCESVGVTGAKTYLQSGNVVFRSGVSPAALAKKIEEAIRIAAGFESKVILRTAAELRDVIAANRFTGCEPGRLLVAFLGGPIAEDAKALLMKLKSGREEIQFADREIYLNLPDGAGVSKLAAALTEKKIGVTVTARNWNTVNALLKMAEDIER
jgi:uncharacterized protein (DUF1697 family)